MATVNIRKPLREEADVASEFVGREERAAQPAIALTRLRRSAASLESFIETRGQSLSSTSRLQCIQQSSLFRGLSAAQYSEVASLARELRFGRRQIIFREGDPVDSVSVLATGRVKVTQLSRSGAEVILRIKGNGEVVGGLGVQPGGPHFLTAQTLEPCTVLLWDVRKFEMLEDRMPALQRNTVRIFAERLRVLEERFLELATEQVAPRLARMLVRLIEQSARADQPGVRINLSREELAQMTGTTLFTVSRLLCEWEQHGIIQTQRKAVVVQNTQKLMALAEGFQSLM
jgi:CRP-like cAMP-binding protein